MRASIKGWLGEKMTILGMWLKLNRKTYRRINDVILPSANGTTQIDHVIVSIYGLFVIETKNMDGWIFGSANDATWTQQFFRKRFKFQNPLRQNYRHTKCLAEALHLADEVLHSLVFFIGDAQLKTTLPEIVLTKGLSAYIMRFTKPLLGLIRVQEIELQLKTLKAGRTVGRIEHFESLKERHESVTQCPKCGGLLKMRLAKRGARAGNPLKVRREDASPHQSTCTSPPPAAK
jgi:restriction system protein